MEYLTDTPLVILWSTPRSASTALEKAVMQHPDIDMVHEPFTDCYYFSAERRSDRYGDCQEKQDLDRSAVYKDIDRPCSKRIKFIKELAFQALPYVTDDFLKKSRHIFLINEPSAVYTSLIKLKPDFTVDEFGFSSLFSLYQRVKELQISESMVCTTRQLLDDPETILANIFNIIGISYTPSVLSWEPGPIRSWDDHEQHSQAKWHKSTECSEGFMPYKEASHSIEIIAEDRLMVNEAYEVFSELASLDNSRHQKTLELAG